MGGNAFFSDYKYDEHQKSGLYRSIDEYRQAQARETGPIMNAPATGLGVFGSTFSFAGASYWCASHF